ncbi:hypothetical protein BV25DRAFT_1921858 [Artomyces pyxidatus]|uniref:Uncharacterized protein n=1 Tax=Artomyces pyxidatus TaxID=48021 RepID=A0ACB8SGJ7_9AGAM|nr:hypothetical protein BV25DRAFT_1921858 [Artomyces pyxidatus]
MPRLLAHDAVQSAHPTPSQLPPRSRSPPSPKVIEASTGNFIRLRISSSPRSAKLYNWNTDAVPVRRTAEPQAMFDASSQASKPKPEPAQRSPWQLFDYCRDDPVRFAVHSRGDGEGQRPGKMRALVWGCTWTSQQPVLTGVSPSEVTALGGGTWISAAVALTLTSKRCVNSRASGNA